MEVYLNKSMHKSGSIVLIVIILVAVIGISAILVYNKSFYNRNFGYDDVVQSQPIVDEQIRDLRNLSSSDSIDDIDKDINGTSLDNLDQEINQVDQNLSNL